ncbi:patatin-like phospholipase family protein [Kitasatospora sp. NPDC049285]|uniref:patatin-like phospholipase family protein n=1 Tax=Kitasatospora sp. NPDC049285 TaxID=3157096 RepID=UPI00342ACA1A
MRGLVLGGGGLTGIAWQTGLLHGLAEAGIDVPGRADHVIGTSAGSTVAAQLAGGLPLAELYRRQTDPGLQNHEITPPFEALGTVIATLNQLLDEVTDRTELRRRLCALALAADTVPAADRHAVIAGRLPRHDWPSWPLTLVAVDVDTAEPRYFDRDSGIPLVDAVAASCAVPGIWPVVEIEGHRYTDGGVRSSNNADLMTGQQAVLILSPMPDQFTEPEIVELEKTARVLALTPDDDSRAAFGANPLDPAVRTPAAEAGRAQAARVADQVRDLWA